MQRPKRHKLRLDYEHFNRTGERRFVEIKDEVLVDDDTDDEQSSEYVTPDNISFESVASDTELTDHSVDNNNQVAIETPEFTANLISLPFTAIIDPPIPQAEPVAPQEPANLEEGIPALLPLNPPINPQIDQVGEPDPPAPAVEEPPPNLDPPAPVIEEPPHNLDPPAPVI